MSQRWSGATIKCCLCGKPECDCWAQCELCGLMYDSRGNGVCGSLVHARDEDAKLALQNGYWRTDDTTHRLYKTRAVDIRTIYRAILAGNFWMSRKAFNDDVRPGMAAGKKNDY